MSWALHATSVAESCLQRNAWICPEYVRTRQEILLDALQNHVYLTLSALLLGLVVALPLGVLASRSRWLEAGASQVATVLYTIPSLAMFPLLLALGLPFSSVVVVVGLGIYTLAILLRNIVVGLQQVPDDALDAARGMGLTPVRQLWSVELPLAMPTIITGIRIAAVSTVALVTVGGVIGFGGLGNLIITGQNSRFNAQVLTATVLVVALALLIDGLLLLLQRRTSPWMRGRAT